MTTDNDGTQQRPAKEGLTSPPEGKTHEATTPPGTGETDEAAVQIARDNLEKAGGGH